MALSTTDFYAYSRATGTPFPEDPEERAQLAPEVLEFRRNQLKVPEQGPDYGAIAGLTAAGLGLTAGGVGLARMLKGRTLQGVAKNINKQAQAAEPAVQNVVKTGVPVVRTNLEAVQPSKVVDQSPEQNTFVAKDRAQELIDEYIGNIDLEQKEFAPQTKSEQMQQLAELNRQRGFVNRAIKSKGEQVLAEIQNEAKPFNLTYIESTGAKAPDLTSLQDQLDPLITKQSVEASDPGLDQVVNRGVIIPAQREVTGFAAFSRKADRIERVSNEIQDFSQELSKINAVNENVIKTSNPFGMTEEEFEILGERGAQELERVYERGGRTVSDLTGEIKVAPKIVGRKNNISFQLRKEGNIVLPGGVLPLSQFSDTPARENIGRNRFTPNEILERTMAAASYPREIRDQILNPNVSREEIREFLGSTPKIRGGAVSTNPTMEIAGGARASMPEAFVDELQTAGVGGVGLTYADTANLPGLGQKEKLERAGFVFDPNTGNYTQTIDDIEFEPDFQSGEFFDEFATDYGDTEGVGNLLIPTETFKERTNKSTTLIPGNVELVRGSGPGTERQERVIDAVIPFRKDVDSEQTTGLYIQIDPESSFERQLKLRDVGYKEGGIITSEDTLAQGTKLTGGFEPAVENISKVITTQPASDWINKIKSPYTLSQTGLIRGDDGKYYLPTTKRALLDEEVPLKGRRRIILNQTDPITGITKKTWGDYKKAKLEQLTLDRAELEEVAEAAKNVYFNNPIQKATYLAKKNPKVLTEGRAKGLSLSEIGEPYDYQGFIIEAVDDYLMNKKGIDLPILKEQKNSTTGSTYLPTEAYGFITNLLNTERNTPIYGVPVKTNKRGNPLIKGFKKAVDPDTQEEYTTKYAEFATEDVEPSPIPGRYQIRGTGGVDPMTIGDEGDRSNVAYQSPRIDTISQRKLLGILQNSNIKAGTALGLSPSTQTGIDMARLRAAMETAPTGEGIKRRVVRNPQTGKVVGQVNVPTMRIGSFARTQNPFTGSAAAAMGPASRVLSGNYQYLEPALKPKLVPTSQLSLAGTGIRRLNPEQIDALNQFALIANLTPGGYVRQGALRLGKGDAPILSGVGPLSEGETIQKYGMTGSNLAQFGNDLMRQAALNKLIVTPQGRRGTPPGPTSVRNRLRKNASGDWTF